MRALRIWGVARDPRASLGRRGTHGAGLMGAFRALLMAAVEARHLHSVYIFSILRASQQIPSQRRWPVAGCFDPSSTRSDRNVKSVPVKSMTSQFTDVSKWLKSMIDFFATNTIRDRSFLFYIYRYML